MPESLSRKSDPIAVQPLDSELESRSADHWRLRAAEARTVAEQMSDSFSRQMMQSVAASYDRLAEWAERPQP